MTCGSGRTAPRVDVAVVSDRGCDRVRFYKIDPSDPHGPLVDVTAANVPRVFPTRYDQPSALQPSGDDEGWRDNPLDDQNTVYGLTVVPGGDGDVFVTERERGLVRQLRDRGHARGRLTYRITRTFLFDTSSCSRTRRVRRMPGRRAVKPPAEEPQSEGLVFDAANDTLYVAFETIGLYRLPLRGKLSPLVRIGVDQLIEPLATFGRPYHAIPDDDEFECQYDPDAGPAPDDIVAPGSPVNAGRFLQAGLGRVDASSAACPERR